MTFLLGLLAVTGQTAPHPDWDVLAVQTTQSPFSTSLAFDPAGAPAVSYRSINTKSLVLARWNGSVWQETVVDHSGDVGGYSSLAFDAAGQPAISYYDHANRDLKFARFDGAVWRLETVDSDNSVGTYTSLGFNAAGHPVIAYESSTNNDLKLAEWTGASWTITNLPVTGLIGSFASLAFTRDGDPAIAYYDSGAGDLEYVVRVQGQWTMTPVDTAGNVGRYASLAFGPDHQPAIAYHDQTLGHLKFARLDGDTWVIETVDSAGVVGTDASLAFGPSGHPAVSYFDSSNTALKYAEFDGHAWQIVTVSNDGNVGVFSSLAFSPQGSPWISFADSPTGVAVATRRPPRPPITWIGPEAGAWHNPTHWDPNPPTTEDVVQILSGTVILNSETVHVHHLVLNGTLHVTGGILVVDGTITGTGTLIVDSGEAQVLNSTTHTPSSLGGVTITSGTVTLAGETNVVTTLQQEGGTLTVLGHLTVTAPALWTHGTWSGAGKVHLAEGVVLGDYAQTNVVETVQVRSQGQAAWVAGDVLLQQGATWVHEGEAPFVWTSTGTWSSEAHSTLIAQGPVVVTNSGSVTITGPSQWQTNSTFEVTHGACVFHHGETLVLGQWLVQTNAHILVHAGTVVLSGGTFTTHGAVTLTNASVRIAAAGQVRIDTNAVWTLEGEGTFQSDDTAPTQIAGTFQVQRGTWTTDADLRVTHAGHLDVLNSRVVLLRPVHIETGGTLKLDLSSTVVVFASDLTVQAGAALEGNGRIVLTSTFSTDEAGSLLVHDGEGGSIRFAGPDHPPSGWYRDSQGRPWPCPNFGVACATSRVIARDSIYLYEGQIVLLDDTASVAGDGQLPNAVLVQGAGSTLAAPNTGVFTPAGHADLIIEGGARWTVGVRDPLLPPGPDVPGIDQIRSAGSVTVEAEPSAPFRLTLVTLDTLGHPGPLPNFDPALPWSALLVRADGGLSVPTNSLVLETTEWRNDLGFGHLGLEQRGNDLFLVFSPSPFQLWLARYFSPQERANPPANLFTADFDGDGESALYEFARGHHPREQDAERLASLAVFDPATHTLRLSLAFPPAPHGLKIKLESSENLELWTPRATILPAGLLDPAPDHPGHLVTPQPNGFEYLNRLDLAPRQFFRLSVSPANPWWDSHGLPPPE